MALACFHVFHIFQLIMSYVSFLIDSYGFAHSALCSFWVTMFYVFHGAFICITLFEVIIFISCACSHDRNNMKLLCGFRVHSVDLQIPNTQ